MCIEQDSTTWSLVYLFLSLLNSQILVQSQNNQQEHLKTQILVLVMPWLMFVAAVVSVIPAVGDSAVVAISGLQPCG